VSGLQTAYGKAFEYACLNSLYVLLSPSQDVQIVGTPQLETAQGYFNEVAGGLRDNLTLAGNAAARVIIRLEPQLGHPGDNVPLFLSLQADSQGQRGDVRDILCIRRQNGWEIGLSCKHNNAAVKHNRLSATIDFGAEWFGIPCTRDYFSTVAPLFEELRAIRENSNDTALWSGIADKSEHFYVPLLRAFMDELARMDSANPHAVPGRLVRYLVGNNDFYKVITDDRRRATRVEAINLAGTLNRPSGLQQSIVSVQRLRLPTRFFHIGFKEESETTVEIVCDEGWSVSMRIHNASQYVEPSLKFDVKLIALPHTIHAQVEPW
jgi:hypothetical protein